MQRAPNEQWRLERKIITEKVVVQQRWSKVRWRQKKRAKEVDRDGG